MIFRRDEGSCMSLSFRDREKSLILRSTRNAVARSRVSAARTRLSGPLPFRYRAARGPAA